MNKLRQFVANKRLRIERFIEELKPETRVFIGGAALLPAVVGLLVAVQKVPEWQVDRAILRAREAKSTAPPTAVEVATLQNEMRKTLVQIVGGVFVVLALYLTYRRTKVTEQGHITDRYTKAIEQLGATKTLDQKTVPNVEVRLGAVYALERIAFDSPRDHWPIMEVLTAYVRENSPATKSSLTDEEDGRAVAKRPSTEIQAILTVLGRRRRGAKREGEGRWLDLSSTDLRGAKLRYAHLEDAQFRDVRMEGANFSGAYAERADFSRSLAKGTNFTEARMNGSNFDRAVLDGAHFTKTRLEGAMFVRARMRRTIFADAYLENAFLNRASAEGARFIRAHLAGASFEKTQIEGTIFQDSDGLAVEQMRLSVGWEEALFEPDFRKTLAIATAPEEAIKDVSELDGKTAEQGSSGLA